MDESQLIKKVVDIDARLSMAEIEIRNLTEKINKLEDYIKSKFVVEGAFSGDD
ncbi:MAG: hypothetical protein IH874_05650 [Candidatus Dadabacteria bacterium]|nr:hypothetical protein [Candidatus Dadabacteria bacterium]